MHQHQHPEVVSLDQLLRQRLPRVACLDHPRQQSGEVSLERQQQLLQHRPLALEALVYHHRSHLVGVDSLVLPHLQLEACLVLPRLHLVACLVLLQHSLRTAHPNNSSSSNTNNSSSNTNNNRHKQPCKRT